MNIVGCGFREPLNGKLDDIIFCDICSAEGSPGECSRFRRECRREELRGKGRGA